MEDNVYMELNDLEGYVKLTTKLLAYICESIQEENRLDEEKPEFQLLLNWWQEYKTVKHGHQQ